MPIEAALRLARALRGGDEEPRKTTPQITALRDPEALARAMEFRESVMAPTQAKRPIDEQASWYSAAGYTPQDVRGGMRGITSSPSAIARASEMAMGMGPGATVFHGSPHKFEKFDASKIGTGEGAQAYGHGLYFAENPAVAKDYATKLAADKTWRAADEVGVDPITEMYTAVGPGGVKKSFHNQAEALDWVRQGRENLYHVDLPDEQIARMIDWDKPLSQQAESVRKALELENFAPTAKGETIYQALREQERPAYGPMEGGQSGASERLRSLGIPGIRYLDQGSRAGGEGTSNYVVFNPEILKILRRE